MKKWKINASAAIVTLLTVTMLGFPVFAAEESQSETSGTTEASVTFTPGELKLLSVPALNFGTHEISNKEETYPAESISSDILVSDLRGTGSGWNLLVSLSAFQSTGNAAPTLQASSISIRNPIVSAVNGNLGAPPSAAADVILTSDNTVTPIWTADSGEGMGVWKLTWNTASTTLNIKPGTSQEGTIAAALTWSLQSAP